MSKLEQAMRLEVSYLLDAYKGNGYDGEFDWIEKLESFPSLYQKVINDVAEQFINDDYIWERINDTLDYYINSHDIVRKYKELTHYYDDCKSAQEIFNMED